MKYLDFLKHRVASQFIVSENDVLSVTRSFDRNFFFIEKSGNSYFNEVLSLDDFQHILKVISDVYGKNNNTYTCWFRAFYKAKKL